MLKENRPPLRYYYENWWKIDGQDIWYLAGKNYTDSLGELTAGKWYFTNEFDTFSVEYNTYAEAKRALELYNEHNSNS